jgi:2-polyprenyl-3-methyl-5-hydroxy-6-metoxy-1,4-benzoquinol methylase
MRKAELVQREDLESVCRQKYGELSKTGWRPRLRHSFGYFTPDEYYEAVVGRLVQPGCAWLDVGGGRDIFPDNRELARELANRCGRLVAVDPDATVEENPFAHTRVRARIEDYASEERFDLATLRMVAEHIEQPESSVASLARLVKPGGKAVVYTINKWSPVSLVSWLTPFGLHHRIKQFFWNTEEKDTFPVAYRMNSHRELKLLFQRNGFRETAFAYLDDCRTLQRFRLLTYAELTMWKLMRTVGMHYPENCLLGIYERQE